MNGIMGKKFRFTGILSGFCMIVLLLLFVFGIKVNAAELPEEVTGQVDQGGLKKVYDTLFSDELQKNNVAVVSKEEAQNLPIAMVRLDNGKVAYYLNGSPYFPLAVETGWWDTRVDNNGFKDTSGKNQVGDDFKTISDEEWNTWFSDMREIGFNAVQLMIYWKDWEPEAGTYDFSFLDHVTGLAKENGLNTEFIIFFHSQTDNIPRVMDNFWGYDLDNVEVDGKEYSLSMQWGDNVKNASDVRRIRDTQGAGANGVENFLEYWHPEVFGKITDALTALAEHYRDSSNIIGYQIGNEEGFNYYVDNGDDKNPYYAALYEYWKAEHPGESKDKFRADTINNLWKCFSNAIHEADPYKPTTTNTQSGNMEKGNVTYPKYAPDGMTMDIYKNVDMVGSMFYGGADALYPNLDKTYATNDAAAYSKGFPLLFPTEISATMNEGSVAKGISAQTIARGGQGIGLYCYGEMYSNFEKNNLNNPLPVRNTVKTMLQVFNQNLDKIHSAIPVTQADTKNVYLTVSRVDPDPSQGNPVLSVLNTEDGNTFGVFHFTKNVNQGSGNAAAAAKRKITVELSAKEAGEYRINLYQTNGTVTPWVVKIDSENGTGEFEIDTTGLEATYITVDKAEEVEIKNEVSGILVKNLPEKIIYGKDEVFAAEGLKVNVRYTDGTEKELVNGEYEVSAPDMSAEGSKKVVVKYSDGTADYSASFEISVLAQKYESSLEGIDFDSVSTAENALGFLFDGNINVNAHFKAQDEDVAEMENGQKYVQYNFGQMVNVSGIDLYAINGNAQGIHSFKVAVPNEEGEWNYLTEEGKTTEFSEGSEYKAEWLQTGETEKVSVAVPTIKTDKIRIYITSVGREWQHNGVSKFAMREIGFQYETVPALIGICLDSFPEKVSYVQGEQLNSEGMAVKAIYSDDTSVDITDEVSVQGFDSNIAGTQWITVTYKDSYATGFKVEVSGQEKLSVTLPDKTRYTINERFDPIGMKVSVIYSNGETKEIPLDQVSITGFDSSTAGEKIITVTYDEMSAEFSVMIVNEQITPTPPQENESGSSGQTNVSVESKPDNTQSMNGVKVTELSSKKIDGVPKTGDSTNPVFWGILAALAGIVMIAAYGVQKTLKKHID